MDWLLVAAWYVPCIGAAAFFAMVAFRMLGAMRDDDRKR